MLKFDIIEQENNIECTNKLENYINTSLEDPLELKNYILIEGTLEGRERDFIGGALLLKKELYKVQEDVRELVGALPLQGFVWECSFACLRKDEDQKESVGSISPQEFYRGLYNKLVDFGKMKGIGFVIMKLLPETYLSSKELGAWPYVVELKPENSPDKLFHGILPLAGSQCKIYQNSWKI